MEEEEFLREFDEVTIGYPVTKAGHLQSLYTGRTAHRSGLCSLKSGAFTECHTSDWVPFLLID